MIDDTIDAMITAPNKEVCLLGILMLTLLLLITAYPPKYTLERIISPLSCILPIICCQNGLYFALSSYFIFQDFPNHMIGYVILVSNSMKKITVCPDDRLL